MRWLVCAVLVMIGSSVLAEGLTSSVRPVPRPVLPTDAAVVEQAVEGKLEAQPETPPDPNLETETALTPAAETPPAGLIVSIRPMPRPANLGQTPVEIVAEAPAPTKKTKGKASRAGSVCGDPDIKGIVIPPVTSKTKGCGIDEPVKITEVAGVRFSQPATVDCGTAIAFKKWIIQGMRPAFGNREVVQLHIFGSYSCRARNNVRGAKISEHGRGKAIDVAGFVLSNGQEWTIKKDYNKTIRKAYKAACGIFGTTLGPGSDGYHEDHLHFDTADHSNGAYCR